MRIASLTLRNFKAIGPVQQRIDFRPITLLYGPNSAGKSTIVQALHYLSEILSRNNCDPGTTQIGGKLNLGGFRNLVHMHDSDSDIEIGIGLRLGDTLLPGYGPDDESEHIGLASALQIEEVFDLSGVESVGINVCVSWSHQHEQVYVSSYSVDVNGEHFATVGSSSDLKTINLVPLNYDHRIFEKLQEGDEEKLPVGVFLEDLVKEFSRSRGGDWDTKPAPIQLTSGRGALPVFGRLLPFATSNDTVDDGLFSADQLTLPIAERKEQLDIFQRIRDSSELGFECLNRYLSRVVVGAGELATECLQQFLYLGPLRDIPGRHYSPELSPELGRWSSGLGAWDQLYNEGERLAEKINAWLADDKRLDAGYEVHYSEYKPLPLESPLLVALRRGGEELLDASDWIKTQLDAIATRRQVTLRDLRTDMDLYPEDLGTGISQVLPVLVAALGHNKNIVAIEQPELHVHPKFQVALGELFIHAAKDEDIARDSVFILETHSEYMMLRFLRRLYETANDELEPDAHALTPEDIGVYYVNPMGDATEIVPLRLTEEGEFLDRWPNGFFPERKKELF